MDHASELEIIPLSSGIDDNDVAHKSQSHPFSLPRSGKQIVMDIQHNLQNRHKATPNPAKLVKKESIPECENKLLSESASSLLSMSSSRVKSHPFVKIIAPSIGFFGCQFAWACQGGYVDPYLRQLGLANDMMNYAWILGPISGLIFQPMIGVFSDQCHSKFGRRRPFFLAGAIILSICLFLFSHAKAIGVDMFGDDTRKTALVLAFVCFWFLDFSTNFMEGPLRALCSDTLTEKEQLQSNSWFGIMNGLASTAGFALGYFTNDIRVIFGIAAFVAISTSLLTSCLITETPHSNTQRHHTASISSGSSSSAAVAGNAKADESSDEELGSGTSNNSTDKSNHDNIAGIVVENQHNVQKKEDEQSNEDEVVSAAEAITLPQPIAVAVATPIEQHDANETEQPSTCKEIGHSLHEMVYGLRHMPSIVARCWIVQFCTYFSNFACWVYLTDYFGENIMKGDALDIDMESTPDDLIRRAQYDLGVEYGNLAFMFIAGISAGFSLMATRLVNVCGLKHLWIACLLVYSVVMLLSPFIHDLTSALFLFSFIGFPMGASFTLPWAVVSNFSAKKDPDNAGLWLSSLNIAECGPELTVGLLGGFIIDHFKDDVSSVFFVAGLVNLVSVALVLRVDTTLIDHQEHNNLSGAHYDFVDNHELDDDEENENEDECVDDDAL